jgi:hypothetical protein
MQSDTHIPVFDKSARSDGTLARSDFTYHAEDDNYLCPGGKRLRPSNRNFKTPRPLANAAAQNLRKLAKMRPIPGLATA